MTAVMRSTTHKAQKAGDKSCAELFSCLPFFPKKQPLRKTEEAVDHLVVKCTGDLNQVPAAAPVLMYVPAVAPLAL